MDASSFDRLAVVVADPGTRRSVLALLSAVGLGTLLAKETGAASICLANGEHCDPNASPNGCCSGKCSRKKKRCRLAPSQGTCDVTQNDCVSPAPACNGDVNCVCYVTLRGWSICGSAEGPCGVCENDHDCKSLVGKRARCVECATTCATVSKTVCVRPCPTR